MRSVGHDRDFNPATGGLRRLGVVRAVGAHFNAGLRHAAAHQVLHHGVGPLEAKVVVALVTTLLDGVGIGVADDPNGLSGELALQLVGDTVQ